MQALTVSITDAAKALNVSRPTIYKLIQNGKLKTFTIGRRRLVTPEALSDFVKAQTAAE